MVGQKNNRKVSIIGVGFVGSTIAYALMMKGLVDEIVLIDINRAITDAESLDIRHGIPYMGLCNIHSGDYSDIVDSDLIVITAGRNRRPNESRLDMASDNVKIAKSVCTDIKRFYNSGVVLVVSNPVDIITTKVTEWLGLPKGVVFGTGCLLDSSRFTNVIADYLHLDPDVVNAQIIGEHGSSQIALWSRVTIAGMPLEDYCKSSNIDFDDNTKKEIETKVITMGTDIIKGKGKTHYGIATCVCYIADAILTKRATIVSVSSVLNGEYGINDVALSIPSIVTSNGIERTLDDYLGKDEYVRIKQSFEVLHNTILSLGAEDGTN